ARALHLSLLGKDVTFGVTGANVGATVGSTLSAVANAAGQLLQPRSSSSVSLSRDNSSAADPADGVQRCALPALPQPIASLLTANVACSLTKADIAAAAPHALGQASVLSLSLQANSVLKTITDQVQLGNTVSKVTDALQPVFDAVSQATGQQVNLDP